MRIPSCTAQGSEKQLPTGGYTGHVPPRTNVSRSCNRSPAGRNRADRQTRPLVTAPATTRTHPTILLTNATSLPVIVTACMLLRRPQKRQEGAGPIHARSRSPACLLYNGLGSIVLNLRVFDHNVLRLRNHPTRLTPMLPSNKAPGAGIVDGGGVIRTNWSCRSAPFVPCPAA